MKKVTLAIVSNVLMIVLPLLAVPSLMLHYKILVLIVISVAMWLTMPAVTAEETSEKKDSDKFSVLLILIMSVISVMAPVIDWAYFMQDQSSFTWVTSLGIVMMLSGMLFRAWAVKTLGEFFTATVQIKNDHQLVTAGPYSIVRHPSYTGAFLSIVGSAVVLHSWIGFAIAFACMTIAYYVRIRIEETKLTAHFGQVYLQYQHTTKRIIPFIW
ncbi:methyltransferase family protein [Aridibaculum aurantiacum]|uniref:methyltransferase family protein n=1 Tax=Aridibaculum aurantiacum TaxID=2810307 RepID=UPI001A962BB9|nr:isoprenylcysteine carboxylmethyltransferase family protein [Aridibaculum aurantiacum]